MPVEKAWVKCSEGQRRPERKVSTPETVGLGWGVCGTQVPGRVGRAHREGVFLCLPAMSQAQRPEAQLQ